MNKDKKNLASGEPNEQTKTAENVPPKTLWYLRFSESIKPKQIVVMFGIGTIYGLLFVGLILMPFQTRQVNADVPVTDSLPLMAMFFCEPCFFFHALFMDSLRFR